MRLHSSSAPCHDAPQAPKDTAEAMAIDGKGWRWPRQQCLPGISVKTSMRGCGCAIMIVHRNSLQGAACLSWQGNTMLLLGQQPCIPFYICSKYPKNRWYETYLTAPTSAPS